MADPLVILTERLAPAFAAVRDAACAEAGTDPATVPAPPTVRRSDRADFQADGALPLAKRLGRNPREVAAEVQEAATAALEGLVAELELAGPGFLNLTLDDGAVADLARRAHADAALDVAPDADAGTVVVDYSAPNVAKEMHVGHLRSTVIGDALVRVLERLGHTVVRENHVGDWGTPFGMLIEHLVDVGEDTAVAELSVGDLNGFYQAARASFDGDDAFKERARRRVVSLQAGDPETLRLWRILVDQSTEYFQTVYDRLGVRLTPDDVVGESAYNDALPAVVADLDAAGILVLDDGAECVFPPGFTNRDGEPQPMIVRKGDGGYGYAATDLATIRQRVDVTGAERILYVVGAPQRDHLEMVFAVARMAGWLPDDVVAEHVPFGNLLGADGKMFKTRAGTSVRLVDLLDEAVDRARDAIAERNPDLVGEEAEAVAAAVGIGAIKYADLSSDRVKDYVLDFDRMLAFEGATGPYLQYAHARIRSIFRRGEVDVGTLTADVDLALGQPQERALALALLGFEGAVRDTARTSQPHRLCGHLFDLAQTFTSFYEACPVLKADDEATRASRLVLCDLTARTLAAGLDLLGIAAPDRM
ncbi:arginine--tRNA ligase [Iamia majanohamensis]|uniref:Arginine--tRNA ligase n=1 Tax=Iamia majanohamensis TaxID=467976 RepID=A0AAE9Y6A9_9ACTN|nr:arginine--tRNA ligase [Iamia majanohamensis]WCO65103.1 arginine--tRNA ligase [Iamia majanohamensis]